MGKYITNKVYITYNRWISDKLIQAILLFWPYYFIYLSNLMVALFVEMMRFNTKYSDMVPKVCLIINFKPNPFTIPGSAMQAPLLWARNRGVERFFQPQQSDGVSSSNNSLNNS